MPPRPTPAEAYEKSKAKYESWAIQKQNESDGSHRFRIAMGMNPKKSISLLAKLEHSFHYRYYTRLLYLKDAKYDTDEYYQDMRRWRRHVRVCEKEYTYYPLSLELIRNNKITLYEMDVRNSCAKMMAQGIYQPELPYYLDSPSKISRAKFDELRIAEVHGDHSLIIRSYYNLRYSTRRQIKRTETIKEDLYLYFRRRSAIAACRAYKEDLMAETWHPRRVQKILDIGGFELLDEMIPG